MASKGTGNLPPRAELQVLHGQGAKKAGGNCIEKREGHEEAEGCAEGCLFSLKISYIALFFRVAEKGDR